MKVFSNRVTTAVACSLPIAASDLGKNLHQQFADSWAHSRVPWTFGEPCRAGIAELRKLADECASEGWDGYGAPAISDETLQVAEQFVQCIPPNLPKPEIGATASGEITFEWARNARKIVSVGLASNNELHYASLNGARKQFGSMPFDGRFDPALDTLIRDITC